MSVIEQYLLQLNTRKRRWRIAAVILTILSFIVALVTVWNLRMTGITIANSATCGYVEHQHIYECPAMSILVCGYDDLAKDTTEVLQTDTDETEQIPEKIESSETSELPEIIEIIETSEIPETIDVPETSEIPETINVPETSEIPETIDVPETSEIPETIDVPQETLSTENEENSIHIHSDECYQIVYECKFEEHIHKISCYSDPKADLETADIWEATLPELTGNKGTDVFLIAQSQLGYHESEKNYMPSEDEQSKYGITRYGQWYGNPYGDWANMFTAFCLRYGGISEELVTSGAEVMRNIWEEAQLYRSAETHLPSAGDVVFLDKNNNGTVDTTAIVSSLQNGILTVIEGDVENTVAQTAYATSDGNIIGYGISSPETRVIMYAAAPKATGTAIGTTVTYSTNTPGQGGTFIIYTTAADGKHYAIDGNGNAVEIQIDASGVIYANVSDQNTLYWNLEKTTNYDNRAAYYIRNVSSGRYLHPNRDNGTYGPLHPDRWSTAFYNSNSGVKLRGARQDAYVQLSGTEFTISNTQNNGSTMYFGKTPTAVNLWLDGTNGNIMSYRGSDNTKYTVYSGIEAQLPSQWKSPTKYSYTLAGWVDIKTGNYYLPGDKITITEDTVLYADWVATTYDIGQYNSLTADTVSTNDFITTHVFDYSSLINLLSTRVTVNVSGSGHSETWTHVGSGNVNYKNQSTLNFSFNDHDSSGTITNLNNLNDPNKYTGGNGVYTGIYNDFLGDTLFSTDNLFDPTTGEGVVGKHYLGQGDHLFQINTDPTSEYYGYYYYDAKLNAASYNQTDQRFYVYDYLERSSDSANNDDDGRYSDFLPLNSPYANTNGQIVNTYNYVGDNGEYPGVSHYSYDSRYDSDGSATNLVKANLWFGMRVDVQFGLPDTPGKLFGDGKYGNKDIYGNDMHFKFTGDDDVWILVDGKIVLDLGGIHQAAEGDINFSTGEIRVNGRSVGTLSGIDSGEHTLTILYLERGSSMSNCAIYFNLAPRFSLTLQKEDILTQEILNGAQFAFFHDLECTDPCELWPSQQAYKNGEEPTNEFTIQNGQAYIWGLSPSRTYYIKESAPPNAEGYDPAKGVIRLTLDKNGLNSYGAVILEGVDSNGNKESISPGYTIHGFRIDEENQAAYIVITNAQNWVTKTTSVSVEKNWNDSKDHTYDSATFYLNIVDENGTRRIREILLSEENDWSYTWVNLPKFEPDPETMTESDIPIQYTVTEAYVPGYTATIEKIDKTVSGDKSWAEAYQFETGEKYVLSSQYGALGSTQGNPSLRWISIEEAKTSPYALWTATVSSNETVILQNGVGQYLQLSYRGGDANNSIFTTTTETSHIAMKFEQAGTQGIRIYHDYGESWNNTRYYIGSRVLEYNGVYSATQSGAVIFKPLVEKEEEIVVEDGSFAYRVYNTPIPPNNLTSVTVNKHWDMGINPSQVHNTYQIPVKLYSNGVYTGRTEILSLQNGWTVTFDGLPFKDENNNVFVYTVEEVFDVNGWKTTVDEMTYVSGSPGHYTTLITNCNLAGYGVELPSTGGTGTPIYILFGLVLVLAPFVYGFSMRRRHERRSKN